VRARAEEAAQKAAKRKAEADERAAAATAKRVKLRKEECEEALRQIHLLRNEMETQGGKSEELLAKLVSLDFADEAQLAWMTELVAEAQRAQQQLLALIESNTIDWQVEQHAAFMDAEDGAEEEDESEEEGEEEEEDDAGVRVGQFGRLHVVTDEETEQEGADTFDEGEYARTMKLLRKGFMSRQDLEGVEHD
jgi:hypothetical protein